MLTPVFMLIATSNFEISNKKNVGKADFVLALDSNGDGIDEIITINEEQLTFRDKTTSISGKPHVFARGDLDRDGKEEAYIGLGFSKKNRTAAKQILRLDDSGSTLLWSENGKTNHLSDLHITDGKLFLVGANDNGKIRSGWIENGKWVEQLSIKLGLRQYPLSTNTIAVGRVYGDEPKSDGDLFIYRAGKKSSQIPTFRGIRALAVSDINGDQSDELLVSDGWHYKYGTDAVARIRLHTGKNYNKARTIAEFKTDYTINRIEVHKNLPSVFLAQGSHHAHLVYFDSFGWNTKQICKLQPGANAVFHYNKNQTSVLCAGPNAVQVILKQ